jgi:pyrroloquinoline quinone (PQQ) biosynthesis protein C
MKWHLSGFFIERNGEGKKVKALENLFEEEKNKLIIKVQDHSFLRRCRDGSISLDELKSFVVQQGKYSAHFTRYLCALMSNLPTNADILELAENLFEECGFEDKNSIPHSIIYKNMMEKMGVSLESAPLYPETENLIAAMLGHCKNSNPAYGLGALCLGAEALVPIIYSDLITGFKARGVPDEHLEFFSIHVECDDGHAETIRDIMVEISCKDEQQAKIIVEAGAALVSARMEFFSGIERRHYREQDKSVNSTYLTA